MPTGYTAGILDGKITTFPQFAKVCMKAFGACIHMRDDDMDTPYIQRVPSDYHIKEIKKAQEELKKAETFSDKEILKVETKRLKKDILYYEKKIDETINYRVKLEDILSKINAWIPPDKGYTEYKNFMIQQVSSTIDFDGNTKYYHEKLDELKKELKSISAQKCRDKIISEAKHDIEYHTKENNEEIERCNESNKWVENLLKSL